MKRILSLLTVCMTLFCFSCSEYEEVLNEGYTPSVNIEYNRISYTGQLRLGVDAEDVYGAATGDLPYLSIPFTSSNIEKLSFIDSDRMPEEFSVECYQYVASGSRGTMYVPIQGTPITTGNQSLYFYIEDSEGNRSTEIEVRVYVLDEFESITDFEFTKGDLDIEATLTYDFPISENADGKQRLLFRYSCGWGRTVDFEITEGNGIYLDPEYSTDVKLNGGDVETLIELPILGTYTGTDGVVTLSAIVDDMAVNPTIESNAATVTYVPDLVYSVGFDAMLYEGIETTVDSLVITYTNGYGRSIYVSSIVDNDNNLWVEYNTETPIQLAEGAEQSTFTLPIKGTPTAVGPFTVYVQLVGQAMPTSPALYTGTTYVGTPGNPITITNVVFDSPVLSGSSATATTVTVEFDPATASVGGSVELSTFNSAYLNLTTSQLTKKTIVLTGAEAGQVVFDLSDYFETTDYSRISKFPYADTLSLAVNYDRVPMALPTDQDEVILSYDGFMWKGLLYRDVLFNGHYWLDRNLGATSTVMPVDAYGSMITDRYWDDSYYASFGDYYQRGQLYGIKLYYPGRDGYEDNIPDESHSSVAYFRQGQYYTDASTGTITAYSFTTDEAQAVWDSGQWILASTQGYTTAGAGASSATTDATAYSTGFQPSIDWSVEAYNSATGTTGGERNPCPPGYKVPIGAEATGMLTLIVSSTTIAGNTMIERCMNSDLKIPPTGFILQNGPSSIGMSSSYGHTAIPQMYAAGSTSDYGSQITMADSYCRFMTASMRNTASSSYVNMYDITNVSGHFSYVTTASAIARNYNMAAPVRCVKMTYADYWNY